MQSIASGVAGTVSEHHWGAVASVCWDAALLLWWCSGQQELEQAVGPSKKAAWGVPFLGRQLGIVWSHLFLKTQRWIWGFLIKIILILHFKGFFWLLTIWKGPWWWWLKKCMSRFCLFFLTPPPLLGKKFGRWENYFNFNFLFYFNFLIFLIFLFGF